MTPPRTQMWFLQRPLVGGKSERSAVFSTSFPTEMKAFITTGKKLISANAEKGLFLAFSRSCFFISRFPKNLELVFLREKTWRGIEKNLFRLFPIYTTSPGPSSTSCSSNNTREKKRNRNHIRRRSLDRVLPLFSDRLFSSFDSAFP